MNKQFIDIIRELIPYGKLSYINFKQVDKSNIPEVGCWVKVPELVTEEEYYSGHKVTYSEPARGLVNLLNLVIYTGLEWICNNNNSLPDLDKLIDIPSHSSPLNGECISNLPSNSEILSWIRKELENNSYKNLFEENINYILVIVKNAINKYLLQEKDAKQTGWDYVNPVIGDIEKCSRLPFIVSVGPKENSRNTWVLARTLYAFVPFVYVDTPLEALGACIREHIGWKDCNSPVIDENNSTIRVSVKSETLASTSKYAWAEKEDFCDDPNITTFICRLEDGRIVGVLALLKDEELNLTIPIVDRLTYPKGIFWGNECYDRHNLPAFSEEYVRDIINLGILEYRGTLKQQILANIGLIEDCGRRNSMGCSESWYDPIYSIIQTFSRETIEEMSDEEIQRLYDLAKNIADHFE